ncbi:uncharacterized protein LOC119406994 isoform X1 [Rhipicephalus sanguineus]|uniref:uncharacterized protein LOC119406994 isoform X1 n=1 Tax=Rhipicephalus sanguineus TaxID=34632 RepID=UPI00189376EB|nr:uncharacterized protein LOC119406994 isoform X1 [Rhipicephalus sanguineus]
MHENLLAGIFVLIACDTVLSTPTSPERRFCYDIKKFVNTSEKIWTLKTTNMGNIICEYDKMMSIYEPEIYFQRTFLLHGRRCDVRLRGQFYRFHPDWMTVTDKGRKQLCTERLLYLAPDHSCAVVKIASVGEGNEVRYDLRVRDSSIRERPQAECELRFTRAAKGRMVYHIYSSYCRQAYRTLR